LATHPEKLEAIKEKLFKNRLTTPLFDMHRFTQHIELAFEKMYARYLADLPPEHIHVL
jgi:predicted O-linked N-acetylglucosamine transferase (SPINDLY family)